MRRHGRRWILGGAATLVAALFALGAAAPAARRTVTYSGRSMGTYTRFAIVTDDSVRSLPDAACAQSDFQRVDSLMSNWTATSEVARINREAGRAPTVIHPEVARVIETSLRLWRESDGTNDITVEPLMRAWGFLGGHPHVPSDDAVAAAFRHVGAQRIEFDAKSHTIRFKDDSLRIDLGGIAKGYAVDVAADSLRARGVTDALVDVSGNMYALGHPVGAEYWRIGIRDPRDRMPYFARVHITGQGISTSAKYEQFVAANGKTYGHIMDPRTGRPADGLIAVTVIAKSAMECDAWDTPLFVLGAAAARKKAATHPEFAAILVEPGTAGVDTVWVEGSLRDNFALEPEAEKLFVVRYY